MDLIDDTALIMNPLLYPDHLYKALSAHSSSSLTEALEEPGQSRKQWTKYRMHKHAPTPAYGQPAMMAAQIMYKISLTREVMWRHRHRKGEAGTAHEDPEPELQTVDAFCMSTWKQDSSGGWKLCVQQLVPLSR